MKLLLTALSLFLLAAPATAQETLTGTVTHVRDGDTIEVADVPVRLNGVAAPELDEPRGREGKKFMARLVAGKTVRCELNGERSYDRVIGICYLDGKDIGASIIAAGLARDCPRFSRGRYDEFNTAASKRLPLPGYCVRR
jgi:micrococcal nuclease